MGDIRFVGPGKTRGYPYPVCKKNIFLHTGMLSEVSVNIPRGKRKYTLSELIFHSVLLAQVFNFARVICTKGT